MSDLTALLETSAARHTHLCPRQVLGVRMGLAGAAWLGIDAPVRSKLMLVIVETDGCFADGIEVSTGCAIGHRTLRMTDYGKVAATFVDLRSEVAVRLAPKPDVRRRACLYAPLEKRRYFAQLLGYQVMTEQELFSFQPVRLRDPVAQIMSRPGVRVTCEGCGEEIINEREIQQDGVALCKACANGAYYEGRHIETTLGLQTAWVGYEAEVTIPV